MTPVASCEMCLHNACMPAITIRNVPQATRDVLAVRAARAGQSLQEYLFGELERMASTPTIDEWLERVERSRAAVPASRLGPDEIVELIEEGRREQ